MSVVDFIEIGKADAIAAVRDAAWVQYRSELATCGHPGCEDHPGGVERIHTRSRHGIGADWDLDAAVAFIESAERCGWMVRAIGHDLLVVGPNDYLISFEAKQPAEVTA